MDDHIISLVRESFDLIEPIAPQAGLAFCRRLVDTDPALRRLFPGDLPGDLEAGAARLMQGVATVVALLDQPDALAPQLEALGRQLAGDLPLRDEQLDAAGRAWLQTLYDSLGVAYNDEVEGAWLAAFRWMEVPLKAGLRSPTEAASA